MDKFIETEEMKIETNAKFLEMCKVKSLKEIREIQMEYVRQYVHKDYCDLTLPFEERQNLASKWLYDTYGITSRHLRGLPTENAYYPDYAPAGSGQFSSEKSAWQCFQVHFCLSGRNQLQNNSN